MEYVLKLQQVKGSVQSAEANAKTSGPLSAFSGLCLGTSTFSLALCV